MVPELIVNLYNLNLPHTSSPGLGNNNQAKWVSRVKTCGRFYFYIFMDQKKYLEEISKCCDPLSILVLDVNGRLIRIYCPFPVKVIYPVGSLESGDIVEVQAVKVTLELKDVFIIGDRAYYIIYFRLIM